MNVTVLVWVIALAATCAWTAWRGGWEERSTAVVLVLACLAAQLHRPVPGWLAVDLWSVILDTLLLAWFVRRALVTSRFWPLWACAAQLGAWSGLGAYFINRLRLPGTYSVNGLVWSYIILLALALGVALERRRVVEERVAGH